MVQELALLRLEQDCKPKEASTGERALTKGCKQLCDSVDTSVLLHMSSLSLEAVYLSCHGVANKLHFPIWAVDLLVIWPVNLLCLNLILAQPQEGFGLSDPYSIEQFCHLP